MSQTLKTKQERDEERERIQEQAASRAKASALEHHMSLRCWFLRTLDGGTISPRDPRHVSCVREGCLCECHDPGEGVPPDA